MEFKVTFQGNAFELTGEATLADAEPFFRLWLDAQHTDDRQLAEVTDTLRTQTDALESIINANTGVVT